MYLAFLIFLLLLSPGRPTAANNGQRRPTKANEDKKGPNDASGVVWALGVFLFHFLYFILITTRHESPRQPMTANKGQRRPTKANDGQRRPTQVGKGPQQPMTANEGQQRQKGPKRRVWRRLGPRCVFYLFILFYSYYYETRKPTAANAGQRRPTKAHGSQ